MSWCCNYEQDSDRFEGWRELWGWTGFLTPHLHRSLEAHSRHIRRQAFLQLIGNAFPLPFNYSINVSSQLSFSILTVNLSYLASPKLARIHFKKSFCIALNLPKDEICWGWKKWECANRLVLFRSSIHCILKIKTLSSCDYRNNTSC